MEPQTSILEELARSMTPMADMLQQISDCRSPQPLPPPSRNANEIGNDEDQEPGGATAQLQRQVQETTARGLPDTSDTSARSKGLQAPAPEFSGKDDAYTSWRRGFLPYADFHAFIGCLTGHIKLYLSRVRLESKAVSAGFATRNFENSKIAASLFRYVTLTIYFSLCGIYSLVQWSS